MLLSTFILSIVSFLQHIQFQYVYFILALYLILIWVSYIVWLWNDSKKRFSNEIFRFTLWIVASVTFVFGLLLYLLIRPQQVDDDAFWISLERKYLNYETYGMGECLDCGFTLRPEFMNCPSCGKTLREKCKKCEQIIDVAWKRCPYCGAVHIYKKTLKANKKKEKFDINIWIYKKFEMVSGFIKTIVSTLKVYFTSLTQYAIKQVKSERKAESTIAFSDVKTGELNQTKPKQSDKKQIIGRNSVGHIRRLLFMEEKVPQKKHV